VTPRSLHGEASGAEKAPLPERERNLLIASSFSVVNGCWFV